jgi:hypothetical protein
MKFCCQNCRLKFDAHEGSLVCPRCSSKRIEQVVDKKKKAEEGGAHAGQAGQAGQAGKSFGPRGPSVLGEGKEAWMAAQTFEIKVCPDCGSTEFDLNFKRREKVCRKCGSIFPLRKPGVV